MNDMSNPHARRYMIHMGLAMTGYCVVLVVSIVLIRHVGIDNAALRVLVALLPALPALYGLHAFIIFFRSMDEYHRTVISEATLIATGAVGFLSFAYGFGRALADLPEIGMIWVLPAIVGGQGIAACFIRRRYR